jgi:hypothetical protein
VRLAPELAVAKLGLRDIALLAAFEILTEAEQHAHLTHYRRALATGERVIDEHATAPDRPVPEITRLFFNFTSVFPNLGLAGPFFAGNTRPLKDAVLLAAREAIVSGVHARHDFHARLWDHICEPDRRVEATRFYVRHKPLHSFPPSAGREAVERYCGLWIERAAKDLALTGAVVAAAIASIGGLGSPPPSTLVAAAVVGAMGVTELIRTAYYARRRRRLLSRAATANGAGDLVPNAIVVTTGDAIVVNLRRSGVRAPIFPDPRDAGGPHLRVVRGTSGSVR